MVGWEALIYSTIVIYRYNQDEYSFMKNWPVRTKMFRKLSLNKQKGQVLKKQRIQQPLQWIFFKIHCDWWLKKQLFTPSDCLVDVQMVESGLCQNSIGPSHIFSMPLAPLSYGGGCVCVCVCMRASVCVIYVLRDWACWPRELHTLRNQYHREV